jgi:two-component system, OmpR family, response regulator
MNKQHLLLVEDDKNFGMVLKDYLLLNGYEVTHVTDGEMALETLSMQNFDLCIFDVMMPKKDGFTVAKAFKQMLLNTPFVFLTAKSLKEDVLLGYQLGAEDYIIKPFDSEVLLHKLKVILKRKATENLTSNVLQIGKAVLNRSIRLLTVNDKEYKLSPKECNLLCLLYEHKNGIMPRTLALKKIWQEDNYFTGRSMDVYITKLRKYLQADSSISINNLHGTGYALMVTD